MLRSLLILMWSLLLETDDGDTDDDSHEEEDPNPNREAAKWRTKLREAEARIKDLEEAGDRGTDDEGNPVRDSEKRALSHEAANWRKRFRAAEARIQELEEGTTPTDDSHRRIESAFWRELVIGDRHIEDHESAWDLFTARGFADLVSVSDDGNISGMVEAMDKLVDRYPWLSDEPMSTDGDVPMRRTAPPPKRRSGGEPSFSRDQLQKRLPALRRHR